MTPKTQFKTENNKTASCVIMGFFGIFAIAGTVILASVFINPMYKIIIANNWIETTCQIIKSEVEESSGSEEGTNYKISIQFRYNYKDKIYEGGQYDFNTTSSSFKGSKFEIVSKLPIGFKTICFVNPNDPSMAVLERGFFSELWIALMALPFMIVGFGGIYFIQKSLKLSKLKKTSKILGSYPSLPKDFNDIELSTSFAFFKNEKVIYGSSKWKTFIPLFIMTLLWNIIYICVAYYHSFLPFGEFTWDFYLIFFAIGILLILFSCIEFLKLFNPIFHLELIHQKVNLGGDLSFKLIGLGNIHRINKLTLTLVGVESATHGSGSSTKTETNNFYRATILETNNLFPVIGKTLTCVIPKNKMCSFRASKNSIIWKIIIKGEIKMYPNVNSEFIIKVGPFE